MRTANICMAIALMMVFVMPSQSIMQFAYECIGENATATTYSYAKEPRLVETGYTKGLKSGSFNYLENGSINLREELTYDYGNGTNISNSSVDHSLNVKFKGDRGISEFFARGFFGNNRWISAWKKIRYEESNNIQVDKRAWKSRPSNSIIVDASVYMDTKSENVTYGFDYEADIENGVVETKDATGWTNRTGSGKYDWEQESRVAGDSLNITNRLFESVRKVTAAGPGGDWLPCCISGTKPMIDQLDETWPSDVMIRTLQTDTQYPTKKLTSKQIVTANIVQVALAKSQFGNKLGMPSLMIGSIASPRVAAAGPAVQSGYLYGGPSVKIGAIASIPEVLPAVAPKTFVPSEDLYYIKKNLKVGMVTAFPDVQLTSSANGTGNISYVTPPILENRSCNEGGCDGFDCIYTYDEDSVGAPVAGRSMPLRRGETWNIHVSAKVFEIDNSTTKAFYGSKSEGAKEERYRIDVTNNGDVLLSNVSATAEMAKGMMYENSVLFYDPGTGNLLPDPVPPAFDEDVRTKVTWILGTMQPNETRTILMRTYQKKDMNIDNKELIVKVVGIALDRILVKDSATTAEMDGYDIRSASGGPCTPDQIKWKICNKKVWPTWINASI